MADSIMGFTTQSAETAIFEALGAASMCWDDVPTGVFDSVRCKRIGEELVEHLGIKGDYSSAIKTVTGMARKIAEQDRTIAELKAERSEREAAGDPSSEPDVPVPS